MKNFVVNLKYKTCSIINHVPHRTNQETYDWAYLISTQSIMKSKWWLCKTVISPMIMHWRYHSLQLRHQNGCLVLLNDLATKFSMGAKVPRSHLGLSVEFIRTDHEPKLVCFYIILCGKGFNLPKFNTMRLRQNWCHFADDIFKCISSNEDIWISLTISLKFVPSVRIIDIPALFQIIAWHRPGNKSLSEPMMVRLLTHHASLRLIELNLSGAYLHNGATLHVADPIMSIPCLLMPWLLKSPGQQQPWYWLIKQEYSVSSIRKVNKFHC